MCPCSPCVPLHSVRICFTEMGVPQGSHKTSSSLSFVRKHVRNLYDLASVPSILLRLFRTRPFATVELVCRTSRSLSSPANDHFCCQSATSFFFFCYWLFGIHSVRLGYVRFWQSYLLLYFIYSCWAIATFYFYIFKRCGKFIDLMFVVDMSGRVNGLVRGQFEYFTRKGYFVWRSRAYVVSWGSSYIFYLQGKLAKDHGAGFVAANIDSIDRHLVCGCGKYVSFDFMVDGWNERNDRTCPKLDRQPWCAIRIPFVWAKNIVDAIVSIEIPETLILKTTQVSRTAESVWNILLELIWCVDATQKPK